MQRPKICARLGSVTGLKAGSQPNGASFPGGTLWIELECCSFRSTMGISRSPLLIRLTETETTGSSCALVMAVFAVPPPATTTSAMIELLTKRLTFNIATPQPNPNFCLRGLLIGIDPRLP